MKKVLFLGLGYIGLPTAAVAATHGYQVIGVDVNPVVVDTINQGRIHIVEPDLAKVVKEAVCNGALRATTKPEQADAFFVVVPTPFKQNHRARSEEHTSELQSPDNISYAVFCLKKKFF